MMCILTFILCLTLPVLNLVAAETNTPVPFSSSFTYGDGVYNISAIKLDWFKAKNLCRSLGSELISIESEGENLAVLSALGGASTALSFWTSGANHDEDFNFYWDATGAPFGTDFIYWLWNEPNGSGNCVRAMTDYYNAWNDDLCDMQYIFICEWHPCT